MAQPPGYAFHSNFFILLLSLLSFLQTSVPALPALPKGSPAPGSRESLFFLTVPWANIWFAFPHFLLCLPLPLPGPSVHLPPFSSTMSPCPTALPSLFPCLSPGAIARVWRVGRRGVQDPNVFPGSTAGKSSKICPGPHCLSRSPPHTFLHKTSLLELWPGWTK